MSLSLDTDLALSHHILRDILVKIYKLQYILNFQVLLFSAEIIEHCLRKFLNQNVIIILFNIGKTDLN